MTNLSEVVGVDDDYHYKYRLIRRQWSRVTVLTTNATDDTKFIHIKIKHLQGICDIIYSKAVDRILSRGAYLKSFSYFLRNMYNVSKKMWANNIAKCQQDIIT